MIAESYLGMIFKQNNKRLKLQKFLRCVWAVYFRRGTLLHQESHCKGRTINLSGQSSISTSKRWSLLELFNVFAFVELLLLIPDLLFSNAQKNRFLLLLSYFLSSFSREKGLSRIFICIEVKRSYRLFFIAYIFGSGFIL